jgi:hypothetical protein
MSLTACYDLQYCPPTYDVIGFLLTAEQARIDGGHNDIDIRILPGPRDGFRRDKLPPFTAAERRQMRDGIVVPMTGLLPSVRSVMVSRDRNKPDGPLIGYGTRLYGTGVFASAFARGLFPLKSPPAARIKPYATITLREAPYWPTRNSRLPEWLKVAGWLQSNNIDPVIIRDTAKADEDLPFETSPLAAKDLSTRAAFYAGAALNLFVNNGPAWMAMAMNVPVLICKLIAPGAPCTNADFFRKSGMEQGQQMRGCGPHQRLLWADDDAGAVIDAARTML